MGLTEASPVIVLLDLDVIQVKNLSEWKSQLADKNKEIKEENKRFVFRNLQFISVIPAQIMISIQYSPLTVPSR